jgi:hypothetical protein
MSLKMRERYEHDPAFRSLVDIIRAEIERGQYTPTEIREAAMLAQVIYEDTHIRNTVFTRDDVLRGKV